MKTKRVILASSICVALLVCGMTVYALNNQENPNTSEELAYEVIPTNDNAEPVTGEQQHQILEKQLASRIRDSILSIDKVQDCSVSIHIGNTSDVQIILSHQNNDMLSDSDIQSIAAQLIGSVPALDSENITITDNMNNTYPVGDKT